mmetsp:Transcript_23663/g.72811  ORF Transcript_23663/g.72811 Transcript_23663/m.72811 type:complete len:476 (-) Transcript_23663:1249-2676(-)
MDMPQTDSRELGSTRDTGIDVVEQLEDDVLRATLRRSTARTEVDSFQESTFSLICRIRTLETKLRTIRTEVVEKGTQLQIITEQNGELLRLLAAEERCNASLRKENSYLSDEFGLLAQRYNGLLSSAQAFQAIAKCAANEGKLQAEKFLSLQHETARLKTRSQQVSIRTRVEMESLGVQLHAHQVKQCELLEKLQVQDQAKLAARDQMAKLKEKVILLHKEGLTLDSRLRLELQKSEAKDNLNRQLSVDVTNMADVIHDLRIQHSAEEQQKIRMKSEAHESGERLREVADKVFQLLERLKLVELGKSHAMEEIAKKHKEILILREKNSRLLTVATREGRSRVRCELDIKVLRAQLLSVKEQNTLLASRCRCTTRSKLLESEEKVVALRRLKMLSGRMVLLLRKLQGTEIITEAQHQRQRKLGAKSQLLSNQVHLLQDRISELSEKNNAISTALHVKESTSNKSRAHNNLVNFIEA